MNNCVFPIELIGIICRCDYANWINLVLTCKAVHRNLTPLRWEAKTNLAQVKISPLSQYELLERYYLVDYKLGHHRRKITIEFMGDYWQIYVINHYKGEKIIGESVYFKDGIDIYWYDDNSWCVGEYFSHEGSKYSYQKPDINGGWPATIRITKSAMRAHLDMHSVKYNWFNYLPNET